jgi:hypothetical protein
MELFFGMRDLSSELRVLFWLKRLAIHMAGSAR